MTQLFEVLILDDEHDVADMMSELLASYLPQATFRGAYTGEQAVQLGTARRPSAAILDLEMTGLGGKGAAHALQHSRTNLRSRLLFPGNVVRLSALRNGGPFDHLLSKPVDVSAVVELLRKRA